MPKEIQITGRRFNRLIPVRLLSHGSRKSTKKSATWLCKCDCGKEVEVSKGHLLSGHTQSCGCLKFSSNLAVVTHGMTRSSEYHAWSAMKTRCYNTNTNCYFNYGGRGIMVCDRWRNSFSNFYDDMGVKPSALHSLDRIDVDGNYELSNCRWATQKEQVNNRSIRRIENFSDAAVCKEFDRRFSCPDEYIISFLNRAFITPETP